ncbi:DNA-binding protein [Pseudomonas aeruginosa]|uniref:helix-turn-helix domain-containing protein n=1 Tax=Pseudomonas aeruginosa TaxID=287 RepID=UPI000CFFE05D|nr:helix-turn-helix domain-containing protein [Pseudomonas aeruginosa]MCO2936839.1 helix-turn-helix domain-containing protein [Pseudomonas aeruginosa]RUB44475.1 DNA-binding protein [Pseudomonas aeruginosa]RUB74041.1 DNA-binding protein [Pseudomonas aeruginosa]HBN8613194.1 DNA-binding protein [Pseudomonas aeruginosa]HBN9752085.1 DNA-binding protein [Pseudomonas aeruginosa]
MTSTETMLLTQFNTPLLSLEQVAQILDRSPDGLRLTLRGDNEMARRLSPARRKIGRRVLFSVAELARFIDESQG